MMVLRLQFRACLGHSFGREERKDIFTFGIGPFDFCEVVSLMVLFQFTEQRRLTGIRTDREHATALQAFFEHSVLPIHIQENIPRVALASFNQSMFAMAQTRFFTLGCQPVFGTLRMIPPWCRSGSPAHRSSARRRSNTCKVPVARSPGWLPHRHTKRA